MRKPRYKLESAQKGTLQIGTSCVRKANTLLLLDTDSDVRAHIEALFLSLTEDDFAHTQIMRPTSGRPLRGDVYGKTDEYGLWFIKIQFESPNTVIMSCHEAEEDIELANGRMLRKAKP